MNTQMPSPHTHHGVTKPTRGGSKAQLCLHKILQIISTIPPDESKDECNKDLDTELNVNVQENSEAVEETKSDVNGVNTHEKCRDEEGFMGLLIEAARLIFGEFKDDDNGDDVKHQSCLGRSDEYLSAALLERNNKEAFWTALCEEISDASPQPVVVRRSKRRRVQVLPYKYRDSVVEPSTRFPRSRSVLVGNKRRSS